jgi:hypothetical protein
MKTNKHIVGELKMVAIAMVAGMIVASPARAADDPETTRPSVLFVQNAEGVSYDKAAGTLTLKDTGSLVTWFAERPARAAGHMVTSSFVKIWNEGADSFKSDPPNGNLSIIEDGKVSNVVVELSNPSLKGKDITYTVKILGGELPASGGICSLFIDGLLDPANTAGGGAIKGGATGALIGAISGNAGRGAAIGAGVGLLRGAIQESKDDN